MLSSGAHPFALTASEARLFKMSMWDVGSAINIAGENDAATADGEAAVRPTVQFAVPVPPAPDLTQGGLQGERQKEVRKEAGRRAGPRPRQGVAATAPVAAANDPGRGRGGPGQPAAA